MKIFFDTEFTGLHKGTTLISIGLVTENNKQFYAELIDYDEKQCDTWIRDNVIAHLYKTDWHKRESIYVPNYHLGAKQEIGKVLENWFSQFSSVELVSDVCHYDMVLLIDLFSNAWGLPKQICPGCYDINQDIAKKYNITLKEAFDKSREEILHDHYRENKVIGDKHNALYDAKVIREIYQIVNNVDFDKR
ncbi:3'-5' exoribonuclease [Clostridium sp. HBUAS56010]|uniref:3'-5' exoribonuclease domain-containing protein n=1 Tax=Clostridium sp. HBUAS56010 TaxID=2571127 RepID=UPI00117870FA|nr:3'-5' exoribonuclease [Clostridium sp. HBUAS56010]